MNASASKQNHLGYTLARITRVWNQRFMETLRSQGYYNLKPSFCIVFLPLFENDGQSSSELARATRITKQTVSIYVEELRKKGYVKIVKDPKDGRVRRIFLTAKGSLLRTVFERADTSISKALCKRLNPIEKNKLSELLEKCLL